MKRMSLQWRLTCIITVYIAIICGCLTMFVYKMVCIISIPCRRLWMPRERITGRIRMKYISAFQMISGMSLPMIFLSRHIIIRKTTKKQSADISHIGIYWRVVTYFISGHALRPIREFSDKIEEVQAQNLADSRIEENKVKELNQLSVSYNKMLERLSDAFEIQRQFTANAAHELRTPLSLMQVQLDLYNSTRHPDNDADTLQTIKMITEQNGRLSKW